MRVQIFAMSTLLSFATVAHAQDVVEGKHLAQKWCSGCHQVEPSIKTATDAAPSFLAIARMSSTTETSLTVFLSSPHGQMPDYSLSRSEMRGVSAYILSLRQKSATKAPLQISQPVPDEAKK